MILLLNPLAAHRSVPIGRCTPGSCQKADHTASEQHCCAEDVMPTLDSQVHAYERNHPGRPWVGTLTGPDEVTGDQMVAAMDAVGVDGAILVSPFSMYRYDASYALEVGKKHPGRFA